jgi:hypothetical protein
MVVEFGTEFVPELLGTIDLGPMQAGYDTGDPGDVVDQLTRAELLIGAAAGGAFGAALGALPAFIFTGFLVIAGAFGGGGFGVGTGFGPVFGPHISFAAGAAAAAYAGSRGKMESGFAYHNGKDIGFALGSRPDILAVGAVFGILGLTFEQASRQLQLPVDPIPLSICISAILHRAVFGYSIIGTVSEKTSGFFDMGPFEREETRPEGEVPGDGDVSGEERLAVEPWLGEMYRWSHVAAIGLVAGGAASFVAYRLILRLDPGLGVNAAFAVFGISAASLVFLNLGVARIPVTHHMTLPAATAFMATHEETITTLTELDPSNATFAVGLVPALAIGILFGLLGALIGEVHQRIFYAHASTHFDPPAASIVVTTLIIALLAAAEVFTWGVWIPGTT